MGCIIGTSFTKHGFKDKKPWALLVFTLFVYCCVKNYSGSDSESESEYYKNGYNVGYEIGKRDRSEGNDMQEIGEKNYKSDLIFSRTYDDSFSDDLERYDASTEFRMGYFKGYKEGYNN